MKLWISISATLITFNLVNKFIKLPFKDKQINKHKNTKQTNKQTNTKKTEVAQFFIQGEEGTWDHTPLNAPLDTFPPNASFTWEQPVTVIIFAK